MRSRYTVPFRTKIIFPDHWEVPIMGGKCRVVEAADGIAEALEITFAGEPVTHAPKIQQLSEGKAKALITGRDPRLPFLKRHLESAMAYLECFHDVDLATNEIDVKYEGETPEEEAQIAITAYKIGRHERPLPLPFDMLTRALMAAEKGNGPRFEATLATTARVALAEQRFIDSFRYSFLLIESLFGDGQFKTAGLRAALKGNQTFVAMVEESIREGISAKPGHTSQTATLLANNPNPAEVIDHLVEMRGFYFHGNAKRKDAWRPDEQTTAEALACIAISIVLCIAREAADPMFSPELAQRHFETAINAGAEIVFEISYQFREPDETFTRNNVIQIRMPGTKVTPKQANDVALKFLNHFESVAPSAAIETVACLVKSTGQKVFDIKFHAL